MKVSTLIASLKRLYKANKITKEQLQERVNNGVITEEEYKYIVEE